MSYAAVMTHVQPDQEAAPRLECAVGIARRFGADLLGIGAEMVPPLAFDGGFYSLEADWMTAMRQSIDDRLKLARDRFRAATADFGRSASFACAMRLPGPAVAAASRAADLIVAGGAPHTMRNAYSCCSPAELAITSGRPVLVAPPTAPRLVGKQVLLAWKDAREARRAVTDAMPFLEQADRVVVAAVCSNVDSDAARLEAEDVASALKRRAINAEAKAVEHARPDGFEILRQASLAGADLVVCGAYGHSRLGEWVFGGVTEDLLSQEDVYLLLSH